MAWSIAPTAILAGLLAWIAIADIRTFRIPDALNYTLIATGLLHAAAQTDSFTTYLLGAVIGYCVLAIPGALYFRWRGSEGLGLGDAKLFAGGGAWLGWHSLPIVLLIASLSGLVFALSARTRLNDRIAFGPFLAFGILLVWSTGLSL